MSNEEEMRETLNKLLNNDKIEELVIKMDNEMVNKEFTVLDSVSAMAIILGNIIETIEEEEEKQAIINYVLNIIEKNVLNIVEKIPE